MKSQNTKQDTKQNANEFVVVESGKTLLPKLDESWIAKTDEYVHIGLGDGITSPINIIVSIPIDGQPVQKVIAQAIVKSWKYYERHLSKDRKKTK